MQYQAFRPVVGGTVSVAGTTTSARSALTGQTITDQQVRLHNAGSQIAFVAFGSSTVTATTSDMPLPGGAVEVLSVPRDSSTYVATITSTGSLTLYATSGEGL